MRERRRIRKGRGLRLSLRRNLHTPAVIISGIFVLVALLLSTLLILQHLRSYTKPKEQKWIIGVLFKVPTYATESAVKKGLWNCLRMERGSTITSHCLREKIGKKHQLEMILRTVCAFLALLLELFGVYSDREFKWYYGHVLRKSFEYPLVQPSLLKTCFCLLQISLAACTSDLPFPLIMPSYFAKNPFRYPYISVVLNFSQMWALYCLVQFYNVTHHRLQAIKPLAKFISFKTIVFATWWQGVGIALICHFGVLPKEGKIQNGIQDFLLCIEMAIAAVAHVFVFLAAPYWFLPVYENGKATTQATKSKVEIEEDGEEKPSVIEQMDTHVEGPRTSITESVQDVVIGGGGQGCWATISQAVEPVEKGVTKIKETFHHMKLGSKDEGEGPKVEVEEHVEEDITPGGQVVVSSEKEVLADQGRDC